MTSLVSITLQPLRTRVRILVATNAAVLALHPAGAFAQSADLSGCLAITDISQRVQCYDAIARAQSEASTPAPVSRTDVAPAATESSAALPSRQAEFGLSAAQREERRPQAERAADEMTYQVTAVERLGPGYWQYEMADGSVWRTEEIRRSFRASRSGDSVSIRRGALGAFYLDADHQPVIRIRRIY